LEKEGEGKGEEEDVNLAPAINEAPKAKTEFESKTSMFFPS
jgi:hypothetical protein